MSATIKQRHLEALKYWTFGKNVFPGTALLGISFVYGIVLLARSSETFSTKVQIESFLFLIVCPIIATYTLIEVLHRYRESVRIIRSTEPKTATLIWIDNWFNICLSLSQQNSSLVKDCPKRILFRLWNFDKFAWLFIRHCLGGKDNEKRILSIKSAPVLLYGLEANDKQKLVVIFINSVPFFAKEGFEIYPEHPTLS